MEPTQETKTTAHVNKAVESGPKTTAEKVHATFLSKVWYVVKEIFSTIGHFFAKIFHIGTAKTSADINASHPPEPETKAAQTGEKVTVKVKETPPLAKEQKGPITPVTGAAAPQKPATPEPVTPPVTGAAAPQKPATTEPVTPPITHARSDKPVKAPPTKPTDFNASDYDTKMREFNEYYEIAAMPTNPNSYEYVSDLKKYLEYINRQPSLPKEIEISGDALYSGAPSGDEILALLEDLAEEKVAITLKFNNIHSSMIQPHRFTQVPSWVSHLEIKDLDTLLDFTDAKRLQSLRISGTLGHHLNLVKAKTLETLEIYTTRPDTRIILPESLKDFTLWCYGGLREIPTPVPPLHLFSKGFAVEPSENEYLRTLSYEDCSRYILTHMIDFKDAVNLKTFVLKGHSENNERKTQPTLLLPASLTSFNARKYPYVLYLSVSSIEDVDDGDIIERLDNPGIIFDASKCQNLSADGLEWLKEAKKHGVKIIEPKPSDQIKDEDKKIEREETQVIADSIDILRGQGPEFSKIAHLKDNVHNLILGGIRGPTRNRTAVTMPETLKKLQVNAGIDLVDLSFPEGSAIEVIKIGILRNDAILRVPPSVKTLEIGNIAGQGKLDLSKATGLSPEAFTELKQKFPNNVI